MRFIGNLSIIILIYMQKLKNESSNELFAKYYKVQIKFKGS